MKTLNIIGGGRVGSTLGKLWHQSGYYRVQDVLTRSQASARQTVATIGAGRAASDINDMATADIWMLAVPDQAIESVANTVLNARSATSGSLAFHCSGALPSTLLNELSANGWQTASAHCLLSFANPETASQQFPGTPCALEGTSQAVTELTLAFEHLQARCFTLAAEHKLLYHAGAVFATNFLPVLQSLADQLWKLGGMPDGVAAKVRASLLQNAVNNILALGPAGALTGPAARGDNALVEKQALALSQWNPQAGDAYKALSQLAAKLAGR